MSMFGGSTSRLASMGQRSNSRPDLSSSSFRNEVFMSGNGHKGGEFQMGDGGGGYSYKTSYSRSSTHGNTGGRKIQVSVGPVGGGGSGFVSGDEMIETTLQIRAICHEYLQRAKMILQSGGPPAEAEKMLALAGDRIEHLKTFGMELQQMRIPNDIFASVNQLEHMHGSIQQQLMGMMTIKWSTAGTLAATEGGRLFTDAMGWISQQKRMIQTAPWGENSATIDKQIMSHNKFHSTIQRSQEVDRARDELGLRGDKSNLYILEQEWESLQKMSHSRANQLRELQSIIEEISRAIMWVNEKEEEELVFDWGDKNIEQYIPKKQESYSRLMKDLEEKEKDLNKLKVKSDGLLSNNHPASDKIEAYIGILQTQWSWLLQITKCIHVHLKENAAYSQFFKEANETYEKLKKDRDNIQAKFTCNKNTPLENLKELLQHLEKEKERLMENKRQVQSLVNKSKTIVRLKPRNPEEPTTSGNPIMVQAVCDFKNDQKEILKGNEGILKDNTQRSKWLVTGPGGLDMLIPSVCLLISPPNPLSIGLAKKNEQYYEAILGIWNQLYINIKSLISWQYCIQDVNFINSLTLSMISKMRPEEYRSLIKKLEIHYQEFLHNSQSSDIFGEDDKLHIRNYFDKAQNHYDTLVIQLSGNKEESKPAPPKMQSLSIALLSSLQLLRQKLELAESGLTGHLHICSGENSLKDCLVHIEQLQIVHQDLEYIDDEYLRLREKIIKQLKGIPPESEQAKFLRSELEIIQQKLSGLRGLYSAYNERLSALKSLLESLLQVEDIVKVNEARLTEKETTSLDMRELGNYQSTLKQMKIELDYKKDLLTSIESELAKAVQSNGQVSESFHRCDVVLSKYAELVGHLSDRWRRIQSQIDTRLWDLEKHEKQLTNYQQKSASMDQWINNARKRQDSLQSGKLTNIQMVMDYLNQQKILYGEIKGKKDNVEDVQKDSDTYAGCIKDYELQLASYSSGLETLLNIPIKRTMLKSPATVIRQEASDLQSHYIELLTRSGDHYKFLGELLKNMEELKIRNTRIELLEEELRRLKEQLGDSGGKNKSQEDALARLKLELSQSKDQLISLEEVKRSISIQVSSAQETIEGAHGQIQDLNDQLKRIKYQLEEEKRKKRLAEERYTSQQEEYEGTVRRRQKELDELNWIKIDLEKTVNDKERELERLKILLEEEAALRRNAESDISKVRTQYTQEISQLKKTYETQIHVTKTTILKASQQKDEDSDELRRQYEKLTGEKRGLEDELRRLKLSISHAEEQKNRAEIETNQQKNSLTQEIRMRSELEVQIRNITQLRSDDELKLKEANKNIQEKARQISMLTREVEEEGKKRRALELEINALRQSEVELSARNDSFQETINKLKLSEKEIRIIRVELEKQTSDRNKAEQNSVRLQSRIRELQCSLDGTTAEVEKQKKATQEEFTRRKRLESELERVMQSCKEYTTTITSLKSMHLQVSNKETKYEQDLRALQEAWDKSLREHKLTKDELAAVKAELKAVKQKLHHDQLQIVELTQRSENLYKTIEDKSHQLNNCTVEIERLKVLKDNLTKEKLRLEDELRIVRQERDQLKLSRDAIDGENVSQISALHVQLQSSNKRTAELQALINDLTKEREKLMVEIDKFQKQSYETSMMVHESQSKYSVVLLERDDLLSKLKLLEQDKLRQKRLEDELSRIKHSLETELRNKQRLIDEKNNVLKDFNLLKSQFELKETHLRQWELDRSKTDQDRLSLKNEIERLMRELRTVEERYKSRLMTSETEVTELSHKRDVLLREIEKLQRRPSTLSRQTQTDMKIATIDPSKLVFDGVRRKVTAHQLCDCGIISKATLELLLQGKKTVDEVAVDIQVNLKGRGIIAGMKTASQGKIPFTEAKNKNLLSPESALMLLEAQAATGYIADPAFNDKMPVDTACSRGIVDTQDRDSLIKAEAASVGFKDPHTGKVLSVGQACKKGRIDKEITLRLLQAQESVGGILDPVLSVFLPKDLALDRNLIDEELYRALNRKPALYIDPTTKENISYSDLRKKCSVEPVHGLLLLPCQEKPLTVKGIRGDVNVNKLVDSELITKSDWNKLTEGTITIQEIEKNLKSYLRGSTCIAGIYDEAKDRIYPFYQAMKEGMLMKGTTLELLEAQAASGFVVDPVNNVFLTVDEATERGLIGKEFKNKLLSAERAVTGYEDPSTREKISLFEAIEKELIERGHGIRLLEAQIASGGIIDPKGSHRIDVSVAYKRGYFDEEMNEILSYEGDDTKGFFDPNTKENLTYIQLKERCITDPQTGLVLLPLKDKTKAQTLQETRSNVLRKRRVVIVDPDTGLEMSIREAYNRELIDRDTFLDLSEQECEWEEITIKGSDGATRLVIVDRKTGTQYDIQDSLERGIVDQNTLDKYREGKLTLTQFADHVSSRSSSSEMTITTSSAEDVITCTSPTQARPSSPTVRKRFDSISITVSPPEMFDDQSPVAAVFDTETLEKITIPEAHRRGIVDTLTAQRLLEAQACTGGIINPATGQRLTLNEAVHQCVLDEAMANKLKASQKAYMGFEDVKTKRKMSAAEAVKETWLPYEAGQRFLEFQYLTGGLVDPSTGQRISMEEAIRKNWLDGLGAQKLQDARNYPKNLTCPKTKLKISYKEAMDGCMVEESNGMKLLQATSVSSKGLSSPYNVSNPSSRSGSRTGSRSGSRRGSVDYTSTYACSFSSISTGATY
ncbi:desmoplakin-A isoform X1 [Stigmatopora nigra]